MCNLYSITTNQEAIRALFRVTNRYVGNLPPMPVFSTIGSGDLQRGPLVTHTSYIVPSAKARACAILAEFNKTQTELVGRAVILTDGKAGTVEEVWLDEFHGLRIAVGGHEGKWPVSTIKFAETY
jgi:hypothetical protein